MYSIDMSGAQLLVGYSDVFGCSGPDIRNEISKLNMHKAISIICELISIRDAKLNPCIILGHEFCFPLELVLKKELLGINPKSPDEMVTNPLFRGNNRILSVQMLLLLLKKILVYGDYSTLHCTDYEITQGDYRQIIELELCVVDEINGKDELGMDPQHFLYSTYHLNYKRNLANEFARMYYMLERLSRDKQNFDADVQCEYRDYYSDFTGKYGFTPTEYSSLLFGELWMYYSNKSSLSYRSMWRNPSSLYERIGVKDKIKTIIDTLSLTPDQYKQWAQDTEFQQWDFSKFFDSPYISDSNGSYISISDVTLRNAFFEKLYWLIRWSYPSEDSRAMAFFGRLFEKYIQAIAESAISESQYTYFPEFVYAENKKSSDAYIMKENCVLAIEVKGFSVLLDCMTKNESIGKNNKKLFVDPILQADQCLSVILDRDNRFEGVDEVYIVSVTMDSINAVPEYYADVYKQIETKKKCPKTKYYFNLSIEEFEMLLEVMERKQDIFALLKKYFTNSTIKPFGSYLLDIYPNIAMTRFMESIYKEATTIMKNMLFPES